MKTSVAALVAAILGTCGSAHADPCSDLWFSRNQIYKDAGLCFKTARAIETFGNAGCQFDDARDLPLSGRDRTIIDRYVREEADLGCRF